MFCLVHKKFKLGNLDGTRTIASLLDHPVLAELESRSPAQMESCSKCALQTSCGGTMTCRAFWSTGNAQVADGAECMVNQTVLRHLMWKLTESRTVVEYFLEWNRREGESLSS